MFKKHFFFKGLNKDMIANLAKISTKIRYKDRTVIFQEDKYTNCFYYVIEGQVICTKQDLVVKKILPDDMFGEIGLFNQIESLYSYTVEAESILLMVKYESFISVFGESAIRTLVFSIFANAIKESDKFSKIFVNGEKIDRIFGAFQLKFYFNDTIQIPKEKKNYYPNIRKLL